MPRIARRFTIITLTMALFAVSFSAFVESQRRQPDLQASRQPLCQQFSAPQCGDVL